MWFIGQQYRSCSTHSCRYVCVYVCTAAYRGIFGGIQALYARIVLVRHELHNLAYKCNRQKGTSLATHQKFGGNSRKLGGKIDMLIRVCVAKLQAMASRTCCSVENVCTREHTFENFESL
jgi:hypothetical protein